MRADETRSARNQNSHTLTPPTGQNCVSAGPSMTMPWLSRQHLADCRHDPLPARQDGILQRRRERNRHTGIAQPARRALERRERALAHAGDDLALDAAAEI